MSDEKGSPSGANKNLKRNLPSWMSSREDKNTSPRKNQTDPGFHEERNAGETSSELNESHRKESSGSSSSKKNESKQAPSASSFGPTNFSKLLEGVVFVLSGFVNPERSSLRSQALEMGAEYQSDWNSDCTLLVCAFPNTPKFRQVEADCGTIVSKEWIAECYNQKKSVDIERHLMHAGKPWKRQSVSHKGNQDGDPGSAMESQKQAKRHSKPKMSASPKRGASGLAKEYFPPNKLKKWAIDDLNKTMSWLENQEERPDPSDIKKIAAEGILTCLQDAIDSLKQQQDIQSVTEQWMFIPLVVEELAKLADTGSGTSSIPKDDLYRQAMACKQTYEREFRNLGDGSLEKNKKTETYRNQSDANEFEELDPESHDSDETIEMTEEEIDQAYNIVTAKLHNV